MSEDLSAKVYHKGGRFWEFERSLGQDLKVTVIWDAGQPVNSRHSSTKRPHWTISAGGDHFSSEGYRVPRESSQAHIPAAPTPMRGRSVDYPIPVGPGFAPVWTSEPIPTMVPEP
jgi:hypothetical protein